MFFVLYAIHLLLTVKEGGNVMSDWWENKSDKTILLFGKTTYTFTMQGESMCIHGRKGEYSLLHL